MIFHSVSEMPGETFMGVEGEAYACRQRDYACKLRVQGNFAKDGGCGRVARYGQSAPGPRLERARDRAARGANIRRGREFDVKRSPSLFPAPVPFHLSQFARNARKEKNLPPTPACANVTPRFFRQGKEEKSSVAQW